MSALGAYGVTRIFAERDEARVGRTQARIAQKVAEKQRNDLILQKARDLGYTRYIGYP